MPRIAAIPAEHPILGLVRPESGSGVGTEGRRDRDVALRPRPRAWSATLRPIVAGRAHGSGREAHPAAAGSSFVTMSWRTATDMLRASTAFTGIPSAVTDRPSPAPPSLVRQLLERLRGGALRLPASAPVPAGTRVRPLRPADHAVCGSIYRLLEARHFPPGCFPDFDTWLRRGEGMRAGIEVEGRLVAFGSILVHDFGLVRWGHLAYGMVHPEWHRRGLGTLLLLSRIACLPDRAFPLRLEIATSRGSDTFFRRFGFVYQRHDPITACGLDVHGIQLQRSDHERARRRVPAAMIDPALVAAGETQGLVVPSQERRQAMLRESEQAYGTQRDAQG